MSNHSRPHILRWAVVERRRCCACGNLQGFHHLPKLGVFRPIESADISVVPAKKDLTLLSVGLPEDGGPFVKDLVPGYDMHTAAQSGSEGPRIGLTTLVRGGTARVSTTLQNM